MPIIGKVGRREWRVRLLNVGIHAILLAGAVTMIYPFLIMVSGSFKSGVDSKVYNVLPRYFHDDAMLFRKYVESRFNENSSMLTAQYGGRFMSFEFVTPPRRPNRTAYEDWLAFLRATRDTHTEFDFYLAEASGRGVYPRNHRRFRNLLKAEHHGDLTELNRRYGSAFLTWDEIAISQARITKRGFHGYRNGLLARFRRFLMRAPLWDRIYVSLDGDFYVNELKPAYMGNLEKFNRAMGTHYNTWREATLPATLPAGPLAKHWTAYVKKRLNLHFISVAPAALPLYRKFLQEKYRTVSFLNRNHRTAYRSFDEVTFPARKDLVGAVAVDWGQFIENVAPPKYLRVESLEMRFRRWLKRKYGTVEAMNSKYAAGYVSFDRVPLPAAMPEDNLGERRDWCDFVRARAADSSLRVRPAAQGDFLRFLAKRFPGADRGIDVQALNRAYGTNFDRAINIYPPRTAPTTNDRYRADWLQFVRRHATPKFIEIATTEITAWRTYLTDKYGGSIAHLNRSWSLVCEDFARLPVDYWNHDYCAFLDHKSEIFWEFVKRNYVMVLDVMLVNGSAIINTVIYCALMIGVALLVNPLAAYAMSRFKMPNTYKIILLLMLTMAFPPMVMGIPNFILLRKMGLLNTFFALVLPVAADGYFIFLLKGFFDSLPQELFESATIDGASEWQIFWTIAMSLSKPIMAVIALNAFNAAYRNFMLAFIVCQDQRMWTLMVHIYQLIQRSATGVGFAALVIASIPTFLVFVFCQNIIIRGIVVPTEK